MEKQIQDFTPAIESLTLTDGVYDRTADHNSDGDTDDEFLGDDDDDLGVDDDFYASTDWEPATIGQLATDSPPPYYPGVSTCIVSVNGHHITSSEEELIVSSSKVCQERPPYSRNGKSYPTCGLTCASILKDALGTAGSSSSSAENTPVVGPSTPRTSFRGRGAARAVATTAHASPSLAVVSSNIKQVSQYPPVFLAGSPPPSVSADANIKHLSQHLGGHPVTPRRGRNISNHHNFPARRNNTINTSGTSSTMTIVQESPTQPRAPVIKCVVCLVKPCRDSKYVTCGLTCAEKLCKGGSNPNNCDYCHRRPKVPGHNQCGDNCRSSAKVACLLCKSRPKFKKYHLCGKTCKQIAIKSTPLILEAPVGHATFDMVEKKFKSSWKNPGSTCPPVKKIYKIIENKNFLQPYDRYKKSVGNEVFCYHGTTRKCTLGAAGNTQLCANTTCALCSILRTSFKTSLANPSGAFGPGVYSSSASNKAFSYTGAGTGAVLLSKVVLGNVRAVNGWNEVMSCPPGFNSVVFDRQNGSLNETIVYTDDAIRPVFLMIF
ncbi:hypothetical protein CVT25_013118 [Psilocybe cyanescens]|uniref:Uncharacterized protein n=1 Tax=Psilocybe cyanescens TaxID=93625 RepID=A0A409XHR2_PSICY|nr:hypothetical protein CVT25_013118 [Psilocybe cyanescens]